MRRDQRDRARAALTFRTSFLGASQTTGAEKFEQCRLQRIGVRTDHSSVNEKLDRRDGDDVIHFYGSSTILSDLALAGRRGSGAAKHSTDLAHPLHP